MAGQSDSPGMGDALSVEKDEVWIHAQALERLEQQRAFPERQKSRHVGEAHPAGDRLRLNDLQPRPSQHHDSPHCFGGKSRIREVGSCDELDVARSALQGQLRPQLLLDGPGLGRPDVP